MEANKYPFMATQFHPEKPSQAWNNDKDGMNHSWEAVQLNRHFADQFVMMARANKNTFGDYAYTSKHVIGNYKLITTNYYGGDYYVF